MSVIGGGILLVIIVFVFLPGYVARIAREEREHQRAKFHKRHNRLRPDPIKTRPAVKKPASNGNGRPRVLKDEDYPELDDMFRKGDSPEDY